MKSECMDCHGADAPRNDGVGGCREVVQHGHNGLLCQARNAQDLADKMEHMLQLSLAERAVMGINGRKKMEFEFDQQIVIDKYLAALAGAVGQHPGLPRR